MILDWPIIMIVDISFFVCRNRTEKYTEHPLRNGQNAYGTSCRFMKQKMEKVLENRAELEASDTIIGRMLVVLVEEGAIAADSSNECAPPLLFLQS